MMMKLPLPRSVAPAGAASRLQQRELGLDSSASYENNRGSLDLIHQLCMKMTEGAWTCFTGMCNERMCYLNSYARSSPALGDASGPKWCTFGTRKVWVSA